MKEEKAYLHGLHLGALTLELHILRVVQLAQHVDSEEEIN